MHTAYTYARGDFQIDAVSRMLDDGLSCSLMHLTGKAKTYSGSYLKSVRSLIARLREHGIEVETRLSGPRKGSRWHIVSSAS